MFLLSKIFPNFFFFFIFIDIINVTHQQGGGVPGWQVGLIGPLQPEATLAQSYATKKNRRRMETEQNQTIQDDSFLWLHLVANIENYQPHN